MSPLTHFHPRPPSAAPSSPVRPSTAHSTIRAVVPSPPDSIEKAFPNTRASEWTPVSARPKSEGFVGTREFEGQGELGGQDGWVGEEGGLRRRGAGERSRSPKKMRPRSSPAGLVACVGSEDPADWDVDGQEGKERDAAGSQEEGSNGEQDTDCPDTPTPAPRRQNRAAYQLLSAGVPSLTQYRQRSHVEARIAHRSPAPPPHINTNTTHDQPPTTLPSPSSPNQQQDSNLTPLPLQPRRRNPAPVSGPGKHISVSAQSTLSTRTAASQRSIFSTPGRDELERKKALVEEDEGPFGRVVSVADLNEMRGKVGGGKAKKKKNWGCGLRGRCEIM